MTEEIVFKETLKKQVLSVNEGGIAFLETPSFGANVTGRHYFHEIDAVVRNPSPPVLSIQVGRTIYSIQYQPNNQKHQSVVQRIVAGVQAAQ